jgi:hypothetical protein
MSDSLVDCGDFCARLPADWCDITESLEPGSPFTLALPEGVGALQFSSARYVSGTLPNPTSLDLDEMLAEFAHVAALGEPHDRVREESPIALAAATYIQTDAVIRAWYVSDGRSVAKITYTCFGSALQERELLDCESIVRSILWPGSA